MQGVRNNLEIAFDRYRFSGEAPCAQQVCHRRPMRDFVPLAVDHNPDRQTWLGGSRHCYCSAF